MSRLSGEAHAVEADLLQLEQEQRWELHHYSQSNSRECFRVHIPRDAQGLATPNSKHWLQREQIVRPIQAQHSGLFVTDTRKCCGPFVASIDRPPLVLLDTRDRGQRMDYGFANQKIVQAVYHGDFDHCLWNNPLVRSHDDEVLRPLESMLLATVPHDLPHICWVMGGLTCAHDKALRIARMHFHPTISGRNQALWIRHPSMSPISATCSQLEVPGFEPIHCPADLPMIESSLGRFSDQLYAVVLHSDCVMGQPSEQIEGFYSNVQELVHHHGLPLLWSEGLGVFSQRGSCFTGIHPAICTSDIVSPDLLISGEPNGLGLVFSPIPDPEPEPVNVLAVMCSKLNWQYSPIADWRGPFLESGFQSLSRSFPNLIRSIEISPISISVTFSDQSACDAFIQNSLPNGFLVQREDKYRVRFSLNLSFEEKNLKDLVQRIESSLSDLLVHPDKIPRPVRRYSSARRNYQLSIQDIEETHWPQIMAIEREVYEPARVDSEETLRKAVAKGMGLAAIDQQTGDVVGFCIGGKIEDFCHLDGPKQDDRNGLHDSFYSADLAVASQARGLGIGRMLKEQQIDRARKRGFKFVTGRNRIGATEEMSGLNRSLGAFRIMRLQKQYGGDAKADYYRIPLQAPIIKSKETQTIDWSSGIQSPFGCQPSFMANREWLGPLTTQVDLSTSTTPDMIHYREHLMRILPRGTSHAYFAGSRDHALELCLKCLLSRRKSASTVITFEQGYFGHISTAARSMSDPSGFSSNFGLFDWPQVCHPQRTSIAESIREMSHIIDTHGSASILAFICEICGERSGNCIDDSAAQTIHAFCHSHDIPLVWVETATGGYRCGTGQCWGSSSFSEEVQSDAVVWYPGGQLGHVFVSDFFQLDPNHATLFAGAAEEMSAIRCHEHLRAAWKIDFRPMVNALDRLFEGLRHHLPRGTGGVTFGGIGLYRSLSFHRFQLNSKLHSLCRAQGLSFEYGLNDSLLLIPPLDCPAEQVSGVVAPVLKQACDQLLEDQKFES